MRVRRTVTLALLFAVALTSTAYAAIPMRAVRQNARKAAAKLVVVYDATDYRVSCFRTGTNTALCRIRLISATDDSGNNYDCTAWQQFWQRGRYLYAKAGQNGC